MDRNKFLYDASYEHDACGVGMIADIKGNKSHELVDSALTILENLKHRGAEGADKLTGDGAGILLQIPHEFILLQGIPVPEKGKYGTGLVFLPKDPVRSVSVMETVGRITGREGFFLLETRDVPVDSSVLGDTASATEPDIKQIFVVRKGNTDNLERDLFILRKKLEKEIADKDFYVVSLSSRVMVYKGMLSSVQLRGYFKDLTSPYFTSGLALVHSRFSTNTFPAWKLAQPFRMLAHNGEINTIRGNRGWMNARESVLSNDKIGNIDDIAPILQPDMSDSASLDNALEFFVMSGMSLPHALAMLVPESFNERNPISDDLKAFYEYHSILMEPWDGPAALLFSDGRYAGGMLDRNGLRPARYALTSRGLLVIASEVGTLPLNPAEIIEKGRLQPGKIFMADTENGRIYYDGELKSQLASAMPYREWLSSNRIELDKLESGRKPEIKVENFHSGLRMFGYSREDIERIIIPMCKTGSEPTASMGNDTPLAVFSEKPQLLFNYFRQQFAQVTNPAIDPIREELVMSLTEYIGSVGTDILHPDESHCKMVRLPYPVLDNHQLDMLCNIRYKGFSAVRLPAFFDVEKGADGLEAALDELCRLAERSVDDKASYIVLTDRITVSGKAPIPSLLALSAVHQHLVAVRKRVQTALVVESGEVREVMHVALLLGYGASAVCPYMAYAVLDDLVRNGKIQMNYATAEKNYIKALCKGLYKVMSKMGISTIRSYRGARIFESVGIGGALLEKYFGTSGSSIGGIGLEELAADYAAFYRASKDVDAGNPPLLPNEGLFSFRKDGEKHAWNPETISLLQNAVRTGSYEKFKKFSEKSDEKPSPLFIRDFFKFRMNPIPLEEVEPAENIIRHFVTGAMSFGAVSREAHEAMALAMNFLGARSNTGEGGEDSARFHETYEGISLSSKTKQIASGRFGVTAEYLVNAEEIQIKVAQGAKPGEGGQLPGFKVDDVIARTRHSIPGISLISPPPHHDIYSIEDLAQLIYDLKNVNPRASISVKLVAESGVGTVAAGVVKAKADIVVISGAEGGTGASPISSMRYAGIPPEIGLAEAQQTLVLNGLRGRVRLQTDGQLKTGRDIVCMALLGADEFAFGTAVLITLGCVMMRKCHSNMCPVGVATQDETLRRNFRGHYRHVVNYFEFLAREVREYLALMGFRKFEDIIGRTDLIELTRFAPSGKMSGLDFSRLLFKADGGQALRYSGKSEASDMEDILDRKIISDSKEAFENGMPVYLKYDIRNTDRAVGAMLSGKVAEKFGNDGMKDGTVNVRFVGSAGQSFGAFLSRGVNFILEGEANDYLGKGLSGGCISVKPSRESEYEPDKNIIAGNTLLYGATGGEAYINGQAGERFAVRNSGAVAVVEGAGDHCCEYMTGGRVVVLGRTGRNFAAGMSGGIAYVWDCEHNFDRQCNMEMVELSLLEETSHRKELLELVRQHYLHTGSPLACRMLNDWHKYADEFIMVMPIEYKRVLTERKMKELQRKITEIQRDY